LAKTIKNFSDHLKSGGVLIIEPWFTKHTFKPGVPHMQCYDSKNLKIARLDVSKIRNRISLLNLHYIIAQKNKDAKHYLDLHELGLFEVNRTLRILKASRLEARFLKKGLRDNRGIFVCVKK